MARRLPHKITIGTTSVGVYLLDEYAGIGTIVGVTKVTDTNLPELSADVSDLVRRGAVARLKIAYESSGKRKYARILCDLDKLKTAVSALPGKSFKTGTITSAYFPQQRRLG